MSADERFTEVAVLTDEEVEIVTAGYLPRAVPFNVWLHYVYHAIPVWKWPAELAKLFHVHH